MKRGQKKTVAGMDCKGAFLFRVRVRGGICVRVRIMRERTRERNSAERLYERIHERKGK